MKKLNSIELNYMCILKSDTFVGRNFSVQSVQFKSLRIKVSNFVAVGNFRIQLFLEMYGSGTGSD